MKKVWNEPFVCMVFDYIGRHSNSSQNDLNEEKKRWKKAKLTRRTHNWWLRLHIKLINECTQFHVINTCRFTFYSSLSVGRSSSVLPSWPLLGFIRFLVLTQSSFFFRFVFVMYTNIYILQFCLCLFDWHESCHMK